MPRRRGRRARDFGLVCVTHPRLGRRGTRSSSFCVECSASDRANPALCSAVDGGDRPPARGPDPGDLQRQRLAVRAGHRGKHRALLGRHPGGLGNQVARAHVFFTEALRADDLPAGRRCTHATSERTRAARTVARKGALALARSVTRRRSRGPGGRAASRRKGATRKERARRPLRGDASCRRARRRPARAPPDREMQ